MVRVNGKKIKTYSLDTLSTFKSRVAVLLGTLPKYLYFSEPLSELDIVPNSKKNIIVEDVNLDIKKSLDDDTPIGELIDNIKAKIKYINVDSDIVDVWISYNDILAKKFDKQGSSVLKNIISDLSDRKIYSETKVKELFGKANREILKSNIQRDYRYLNERVDIESKKYKHFDEEVDVNSTQLIKEDIQSILTLNLTDMTLLDLFNSIILTNEAPFTTVSNFYKIMTDSNPPLSWAVSKEESIILKVMKRNFITSLSNMISDNYSDVLFSVNKDTKNIMAEINISMDKNNSDEDVYINRALKVFHSKVKIENKEESRVTGTFYFPDISFNKYILADLALNDDIFSRFIKIDDHDKATKKKSGLYIHFIHPLTGFIAATIQTKKKI